MPDNRAQRPMFTKTTVVLFCFLAVAHAAIPLEKPGLEHAESDAQVRSVQVGLTFYSTGLWTTCASEGGDCQCEGPVRYGVPGKWTSRWKFGTSTKTVACTNENFGDDPAYGTVKTCQCANRDWVEPFNECAIENESELITGHRDEVRDKFFTCHCDGTVRFTTQGGHRGSTYVTNGMEAVLCDSDTFGEDPFPGYKKTCQCQNRLEDPMDWADCAEEGGSCTCNGDVRWGSGDTWDYFNNYGRGPVDCSLSGFLHHDPTPGRRKKCQCSTAGSMTDPGLVYINIGAEVPYGRTVRWSCSNNILRYGTDSQFTEVRLDNRFNLDSIPCSSALFSQDPAPGKQKYCWCATPTGN